MQNTIDQDEIAKFTQLAEQWWDPNGEFRVLHVINPVRLSFISQTIQQHFSLPKNDVAQPLKDLKILDVGCGGGLVSIPLARLGAKVSAIDAGLENIKIAQASAQKFHVDIDFAHHAIETMPEQQFDVIVALEIIEHIIDVAVFIEYLAKNLRKDGLLIISTINRNIQSYLKAIIAAEYILKMLPIGTHEFNKFLKPAEINAHFSKNNLQLIQLQGLVFDILSWQWQITNNIDVNYFMIVKKI